MKILYISYEIPCSAGGAGGQIRQYSLLEELSASHEFDYIGPQANEGVMDQLRKVCRRVIIPDSQIFSILSSVKSLCRKTLPMSAIKLLKQQLFLLSSLKSGYPCFVQEVEWLRKLLSPLIKDALQNERYDLIHVEHTNIAHWLHKIDVTIPTVLVAQNVKTIMWKRYYENAKGLKKQIYKRDYLCFRKYESKYLNDYNCVVAMSEVDKAFLAELCGENARIFVVPNGADTDYFSPIEDALLNPDELVFLGTMNHPPNNEGAMYFCDKILPGIRSRCPSASLSIVGNAPSTEILTRANGRDIRVTGLVTDTRPFLSKASVVVVPLRSGSGTRLKILEAMSMGKAIVSTSIGAEGIEYSANKNILIADDEDTFIDRVLFLMSNPGRARELGSNARKLVEEKYSWKMQADRLEKVYLCAMDSKEAL
jgi:glycosyltransferase involved in cell wall biosynthesis